eukprot:1420616-Pyramimonas_sp.AAC.2
MGNARWVTCPPRARAARATSALEKTGGTTTSGGSTTQQSLRAGSLRLPGGTCSASTSAILRPTRPVQTVRNFTTLAWALNLRRYSGDTREWAAASFAAASAS